MIVKLIGMPRLRGNDIEYETGFNYFINPVIVRIAEHIPPQVTPDTGSSPVNEMTIVREINFCFDREIDGRLIYVVMPNV